MFISHEESGPLEEETVNCLNEILNNDPDYFEIVNINMYRILNGAILRNAQALNPVSDLHNYLNSIPPEDQFKIVNEYDPQVPSPMDFISSDFMKSLCIEGTGLFSIANSMNHSCFPNVVSSSSNNNHSVSLFALRSIKKNEELFISYIDENLPRSIRQKNLKELYHFECHCVKCKTNLA